MRLLLLMLLLLGAACAGEPAPDDGNGAPASLQAAAATEGAPQAATATPLILPTLLPSHTPPIPPTAALADATATPAAQSTVDFDQPVVEFRYRIAALGLDRRLEGNVSGQITVVDEARGVAGIRHNQGGVLIELQEVLPTLQLEPLPDGCEHCVAFSYSMPLAEAEGEGWLQDPVLLASVENYTTALLGPHFPAGTVLGLRRSATAYDVAHTLALVGDGSLFRWLATAAEVAPAEPAAQAAPGLAELLAETDPGALAEQYVVSCMSAPVETLFLQPGAAPDSGGLLAEEGSAVRIVCPAFSLPLSLLPLYSQLDALLAETLEGSGLPRPPTGVRLQSLVDYRREDGAHLEISFDGQTRLTHSEGEVVTATLGVDELLSMSSLLLESGALKPGLEAFVAGESPNLLLVRGEQGLLEAAWLPGQLPAAVQEAVARLDELIEGLLSE